MHFFACLKGAKLAGTLCCRDSSSVVFETTEKSLCAATGCLGPRQLCRARVSTTPRAQDRSIPLGPGHGPFKVYSDPLSAKCAISTFKIIPLPLRRVRGIACSQVGTVRRREVHRPPPH